MKKYLPIMLLGLLTFISGCKSSEVRAYRPPRDLSEIKARYESREPIYKSLEGFPEISEKNLLRIASRNNPNIQAGEYAKEFVDLLAEHNLSQYRPKFNVSARTEHRRSVQTSDEKMRDIFRDASSSANAEASITQKFDWGLSGKVYVDFNAITMESGSDSYGSYGMEIEYLFPGSATLARQQVNDLINLQEPAKERASFIETMRGTLAEIVSQFYGAHRSLQNKHSIETELMQPQLLGIRSVLLNREEADPSNEKVKSDIQTLEGLLNESKRTREALTKN